MCAGLSLIALFWLAVVIKTGFNSAVELVEPIFTQFITYHAPAGQITHHTPTARATINKLFGKDAKLAYAIFMAESHLRADAVSSTGDIGCTQINHKAHPQYAVADLLDCNKNIRIAYEIYHHQGNFSAWSAYNNGAYKKYLIN